LFLLLVTFLSLMDGSPPAIAFSEFIATTLAKKQKAKSKKIVFNKTHVNLH